jgi:hypothetical protein
MKRLAASLLVPALIGFWACSSNNPSKTDGPCEGGGPCVDGSVEGATEAADARGDGPVACVTRFDCSSLSPLFTPSADQNLVPCCTDNVCKLEMFDGDCTDASAQIILASNYDQSCTTDTDCVSVAEGNFCYPGATNCPSAAISTSANAQYQADVAKTRAASCYAPGNCGEESGPCCVGGKCQVGNECGNLAFDASAETGADASIDAHVESGAGRVPLNHRPSDAQCSTAAPPGDCAGPYPDGGGCASDSDCADAGTNGRCINPGGGPAAPCFCTYDRCLGDTDCPSGQTCACHGAPYTDDAGNTCVKGNCRVDADCGAGEYCSPSSTTGICGDSLAGYYCHTAADLCIDDSDCPESTNGTVGEPGCVYSTTDSRWECLIVPVCL